MVSYHEKFGGGIKEDGIKQSQPTLAKEGKQKGWKDRRKTENKLTVLVNLLKLYLSAYRVF